MDDQNMVTELNQLLKGSYMGIQIFEDLKTKLQSEQLRKEFHGIIDKFHMHAHSLSALVQTCNGEPVETAGVKGVITEVMETIKNLKIRNDCQILEEAVRNMDAAMKALNKFISTYPIENEHMRKILRIMQEDYESIYHMLHKYLIEFE